MAASDVTGSDSLRNHAQARTRAAEFLLSRHRFRAAEGLPWLIAIAGTCMPLMVFPAPVEPPFPAEILAVAMLCGLFLSFGAKMFLRRSFGIVAANRKVQRGGPYRIMRHPMYSGYVITQMGFFLLNPSLWNAAVYVTSWFAMVLRIEEEEKFLSQDQAYRDYMADVRWRLFPGFY